MTVINILVYTDSEKFSLEDDSEDFRLTILQNLLQTKSLGFAQFKLTVINRYEGFAQPTTAGNPKTPRKLTLTLLEPFDEIWFFGWYQKEVDQEFSTDFGGRDNELSPEEVEALDHWMSTGGVLISGDHSVFAPGGKPEDPRDTFLCLGRALGHRVPRAGQLRKWEGPPTNILDDAFDTLVRFGAADESDPDLQTDAVPQTLNLAKLANGLPHPIFLGKDRTLNMFPDHMHEGKLIIPPKLCKYWPPFEEQDESRKPRPVVIADGCDKRNCNSSPVLAVYDGDNLGVGRIVADSSWHHYLNVNLRGFPDTGQGSFREAIGQLFQNLALYLAPRDKRKQASNDLIAWLVRHPAVEEERGNDPVSVGKVALKRLSQICTGYEIAELLQLALFPKMDDSEGLSFLSLGTNSDLIPSKELLVGSIINRHYRDASARLSQKVAADFSFEKPEDIVAAGVEDAFIAHRESLKETMSRIPGLRLKIVDADA